MANDEVLLDNSLTRHGLRRVEVVRMGSAPNRANWIPELYATCLETLEWWEWQEEGVDVHHLLLAWNVREVVELRLPDGRKGMGVMWWIGKDTFRQAATDAATVYRLELHQAGLVCLTAKLPKGTPLGEDGQPKAVGLNVLFEETKLDLRVEDWVPGGYLVIGGVWLKL